METQERDIQNLLYSRRLKREEREKVGAVVLLPEFGTDSLVELTGSLLLLLTISLVCTVCKMHKNNRN